MHESETGFTFGPKKSWGWQFPNISYGVVCNVLWVGDIWELFNFWTQNTNSADRGYDDDGKYHKGKACKWQASDRLMAMLEEPAEQARCEEGEGEASFIRTQLLSELKSIVQLPPEETKQPILIEFDSHLRINPDEIAPLITPFEAFTGLAA